jgi:two-component system chemotaxis sensor kinase CheA
MAKNVGKDITLHVKGDEMQIDRMILEQIHDPLIHLIRNSIDHGIPSSGNITLTLTQRSTSKVELSILDDGVGIDIEKIRHAMVKK